MMRELLDSELGEPIALPDDELLIGDLTAPHSRVVAGGKIQVESKDDIRKRLGRSTDSADAVIQAFWDEGVFEPVAPVEILQDNAWEMEYAGGSSRFFDLGGMG